MDSLPGTSMPATQPDITRQVDGRDGLTTHQSLPAPLPGLVLVYLVGLWLTLCASVVFGFFGVLVSSYFPQAWLAVLALVVLAMLVGNNIRQIHRRAANAPSLTRNLLVFAGLVQVVALACFLPFLTDRGFRWLGLSERDAMLVLVGAVHGLLVIAVWHRYWRYSPAVGTCFGEPSPRPVDTTPLGLQLCLLGSALLAVTGAACGLALLLIDMDSQPLTSKSIALVWLVLGIASYRAGSIVRDGRGSAASFFRLQLGAVFMLAAACVTGYTFGPEKIPGPAYFMPRSFILAIGCLMLGYAGFLALDGHSAPPRSALLDLFRNSLAKGVTWLELLIAAILGYFFFAYHSMFFALFLPDLLFADSAESGILSVFLKFAVVGAGFIISILAVLTLPRQARAIQLAVILGLLVLEVVTLVNTHPFNELSFDMFSVMRYSVYTTRSCVLMGLLGVALLRRDNIIKSKIPALLLLLKGICWYFALKLVLYLSLIVVSELVQRPEPFVVYHDMLIGLTGICVMYALRSRRHAAVLIWSITLLLVVNHGPLLLYLAQELSGPIPVADQGHHFSVFIVPHLNDLPLVLTVIVIAVAASDGVRKWLLPATGQGSRSNFLRGDAARPED